MLYFLTFLKEAPARALLCIANKTLILSPQNRKLSVSFTVAVAKSTVAVANPLISEVCHLANSLIILK
jgi:hypothetical protein